MEDPKLNTNNGCSNQSLNEKSDHSDVNSSPCATVSETEASKFNQSTAPENTSANGSNSSKDSTALTIDVSTNEKDLFSQQTDGVVTNGHQQELDIPDDQSQDFVLDQSSSVSVSYLSSDTTSAIPETSDKSMEEASGSVLSSISNDSSCDKMKDQDEHSSNLKEVQNADISEVENAPVSQDVNDKLSSKEVVNKDVNTVTPKSENESENLKQPSNTLQNKLSHEEGKNIYNTVENQNGHLFGQSNDALQGRDEDSLVAARLMTNLARGSLPFPQLVEKDLTELQVTSNNVCHESTHVTDTQAVLYNEQLLNAVDPVGYHRQEGPIDFRSNVNQSFQTYNSGLGNTSLMSMPLPAFNQGFAPLPLDPLGPPVGPWNQSDLRRHSYVGSDISLGHPQASSTPQESRSDSSLSWDPNHINPSFQSPFQTDPNQVWPNFPGSLPDGRHLQTDTNYENLLPQLQSVGTRNNPAGLLFNPNDLPGPNYFSGGGVGSSRFPLPPSRQYQEQDPMNYGALDYRMMPNGPQFFPIPNGPGNIPLDLDYVPRYPNRDVVDMEQAYRPKHKHSSISHDIDSEQGLVKRRRRSRYSRKTAQLEGGYPDLAKSLFFNQHDIKGSKSTELLVATKNIQEQNDLYEKQERYFVIISPEVNPADVKSIDHKGLLAKYIDYLIVENEQITEMSKSVSIPVDNFIADDPYLSDIIKVKVPFPSSKYIHWLKTYYPNIQVDWKNIHLNHQHSGGDFGGGRTFYIDPRPLPLLLRESFLFFQSEKNKKPTSSK